MNVARRQIHNPRLFVALLHDAQPKWPRVAHAHPLVLQPIAWGKPDRELARGICRHLAEATPPIVIPANPITHAALRAFLHTHSIAQTHDFPSPVANNGGPPSAVAAGLLLPEVQQ